MYPFLRATRVLGHLGRQLQRCPCSRQMSSSPSGLSLVYNNDIAIITMDRQDNRMNRGFFNTLHEFLDQIEGNNDIKGIITTGQGKFFSNGLDMDWMDTLSCEDLLDFMYSFQYTMKRILVSPVPTLAALNGHTFAGGAILAFAHDFRVMNAEKGWICLNEVHLNKTFYEFTASLLSCKIGAGVNVNDALVFGKRFTADEAHNCGMIHSKTTQADLLEHSRKLLKSYRGKTGIDRSALKNVKEDIYRTCLEAFGRAKSPENVGFAVQFMNQSQLEDYKRLKS